MPEILPPNKDWIDLLTALLTPVIALAAIWIARRQSKINRNRLKLELFDRRFEVYSKVAAFLSQIMIDGKVQDGADMEFLRNTKTASILFDDKIKDLISEIYSKAVRLHALGAELDALHGDPRIENLEGQTEIKDWISQTLINLEERFKPYLKLEH